ncbi:lysophospholipid acyltransferase family protein [Thiosulfatihalobacter marinus]|uniref:lysophospholipid acyltransferase family protein n=1 Tax=Thiosulfatihalobacter marinus TaxID=2792481 RepID=UPI0018D6FFF7|nr:lysophospholipid acyltransferase family protein [Thiosulfatihalobacter marinus]
MQGDVTREISYAHSAATRGGRTVIRLLENATGRLGLIRRAAGYEDDVARGQDFWRVMMARYGISLEVIGGSLDDIPRDGPLLLVANHPFGILDGMMMGHMLSEMRGDFRILANSVFQKADEINRIVLPISFDEDRDAIKLNLRTRQVALDYLKAGGAIGVFPGGTVSTAARPFGRPLDPGWRNFTARMIARSQAQVVPVYFEGRNSRLFQIASHVHSSLRLGLLIKEFGKRVDSPVQAVIGKPIARADLDRFGGDSRGLMDFLRQRTYDLSPRPIPANGYGFEFEEKHRA